MSLPLPPAIASLPTPPFSVSLPAPPFSVSLPALPFSVSLPVPPSITLSRLLPVPTKSPVPANARFSTASNAASENALSVVRTVSVPSLATSFTVSPRSSTR
ncbi:hypothetical protein D3C75_882900 [compost metagenome]